jgi:hypothetical protein
MSTRAYKLEFHLVVSTLDDCLGSQSLYYTREQISKELHENLELWILSKVFPQDRGSAVIASKDVTATYVKNHDGSGR